MTIETSDKLLLSAGEAAAALGIGKTMIWALHSSGRLPLPVHLGRRTLWNRQELTDWTNHRLSSGELMSRQQWQNFKEQRL